MLQGYAYGGGGDGDGDGDGDVCSRLDLDSLWTEIKDKKQIQINSIQNTIFPCKRCASCCEARPQPSAVRTTHS